jgi:MtN3 and saliva related transmembrane protein
MIYLEMSFQKWVGITAGIFTTASLIPPMVKLIRDKKPDWVPAGMLIVLLIGLSLWIYYGVLQKDWPLLITNSISLMQNVTLLTLRYKYKNNR